MRPLRWELPSPIYLPITGNVTLTQTVLTQYTLQILWEVCTQNITRGFFLCIAKGKYFQYNNFTESWAGTYLLQVVSSSGPFLIGRITSNRYSLLTSAQTSFCWNLLPSCCSGAGVVWEKSTSHRHDIQFHRQTHQPLTHSIFSLQWLFSARFPENNVPLECLQTFPSWRPPPSSLFPQFLSCLI